MQRNNRRGGEFAPFWNQHKGRHPHIRGGVEKHLLLKIIAAILPLHNLRAGIAGWRGVVQQVEQPGTGPPPPGAVAPNLRTEKRQGKVPFSRLTLNQGKQGTYIRTIASQVRDGGG